MATSCYLKADPLKGESTDIDHEEWIEVESWSFGVTQPTSGPSGTGGRSAARADFQSLCITKAVDKSSVDLNLHCAKGDHIEKMILEVCQETGEKVNYWKMEFENAMVQSVSISGGGSMRPAESVCFVYDKCIWTYVAVNDDGSAGDKIGPKNWNLRINKSE